MKTIKCSLLLFLIGFLIGPIFDAFHTYSGTTVYTNIWKWNMTWWTPLLFGIAVLLIGTIVPLADKVLNRQRLTLSIIKVVVGFICFGFLYLGSGYIPEIFPWKLILIIIGAAFVWVVFDRTWQGIVEGIVVGIVGSAIEVMLIMAGTFHYAEYDIVQIPLWLPFLYFAGSVAIGNIGRFLKIR